MLFAHFFVHGPNSAIENFFFFVDAFVLIYGDDLVGDVRGFLWIGVEYADLEKIGVTDFIDIEFASQYLVGLLLRRAVAFFAPFILKF